MHILGSDIRDARGQDPVARRRLADLIRDACINVRLACLPTEFLILIYIYIYRLDSFTVGCDFTFEVYTELTVP